MANVIEVKNISKIFNGRHVLKSLNFNVKNGEIFGFLGPSGAGKTTTLKLITKQLLPTSGSIDIIANRNKGREDIRIGILSDNSSVYERLTVRENLMLFANIHKVNHQEVDKLLEQVRLYEDKDKYVKSLSKGMKQRLILACAVIHKPDLLFLDEPTSSLDPLSVLEIHKLILELNQKGTTIFLTTHNMYEVEKLCHRIAFLNHGKIIEIGNAKELKQKYGKNTIIVTLIDEDNSYSLDITTADKQKLINWVNENRVASIHSNEPTIEDIFIKLTGRTLE